MIAKKISCRPLSVCVCVCGMQFNTECSVGRVNELSVSSKHENVEKTGAFHPVCMFALGPGVMFQSLGHRPLC